MSAKHPVNCPLCSSSRHILKERLCHDEVLDGLSKYLQLDRKIFEKSCNFDQSLINLYECSDCGLQYFSPTRCGSVDFYSSISKSSFYYNGLSWDFIHSLRFINAESKVLDLACGSGNFVRFAISKGIDICGIDTNFKAIEVAKSNSLPCECISLSDFKSKSSKKFDVITAFQVIEHLDDFNQFITSAKSLLAPNGILVISVPNRERIFRENFEPLDYPPHHLHRWSFKQFFRLAQINNLVIEKIHFEVCQINDVRLALRQFLIGRVSERHSLYSRSILPRMVVKLLINRLTYPVISSKFVSFSFRLWRHGMIAVFSKK